MLIRRKVMKSMALSAAAICPLKATLRCGRTAMRPSPAFHRTSQSHTGIHLGLAPGIQKYATAVRNPGSVFGAHCRTVRKWYNFDGKRLIYTHASGETDFHVTN